MQLKVPNWLSHLRLDRRGLPVPYVNRWGLEENVDSLSLAYDPHVRMLAVFQDDSKEVIPDFTAQNMQRQRECIMRELCQVCARPVPYSRRCVAISSVSVETVFVDGADRAVIFEPWLCTRCAMFAVDRCPALIRRQHDEDLTIFPIKRASDFRITVSQGWIEGPFEQQSRETSPAMWAKIILDPSVVRISAN
jgi:hypothetical protein